MASDHGRDGNSRDGNSRDGHVRDGHVGDGQVGAATAAHASGGPTVAAPYRRPGGFTRHVFNRLVALLTRAGISVAGSRVLEVRGRRSGVARHTPVNLLRTVDGEFLVAPRGETEWVRNLRADGGRLALLVGRQREERVATEVANADKVEVLRAYLRRWRFEVGAFFEGVGPDAPDGELAAIAGRHPVFRLAPAAGSLTNP